MKTAYSYIRWSTSTQGESGKDSRKRQTDSATRWLRDYGNGEYILSNETFVDAGKSGFKGKHIEKDEYGKAKGELLKFIQLVETDKIKPTSILLIDSFDRFSRLPPTKSLTLFMQVIDSGIGLVFTGSMEKRVINSELINKEGYVLQFIIGEMIRSFTESAEKSRKIISAKRNKLERMKKGEIVAHNNMPHYFTFDNGKYRHNDNTKIVKELVGGILAGKSLFKMADNLNERKIKTFKSGVEWSGNSISKILRNRVLIGEYIGCPNYVPPIIDVDTFNKVQNILSQNAFNRGREGAMVNIFRGICYCSDCGKTMQLATQVRCSTTKQNFASPYRYLKCSVNGNHVACKNRKTFRLGDMEQEFFINFLFKHPVELVTDGDSKELEQLKKGITAKQSRWNQIKSEIQKVVTLLGDLPMDELKVKLAKLNKEQDTVKGELDTLNTLVANVQDSPETFMDLRKIFDDIQGPPPIRLVRDKKTGVLTGDDIDDYTPLSIAQTEVTEVLKDNTTREKIRSMLPSVIGKITVDTIGGRFYVYNRMGKMVYQSNVYKSKRNNSEKWRKSLKEWSKAKKRTKKAA